MACTDVLTPPGRLLTTLACAALLSACSVAGPRKSPLPAEGPDMKAIYDAQRSSRARGAIEARAGLPLRAVRDAGGPDAPSARVIDGIEQRFARAPNPDLVMYVFPHLSGGRYPVPGYFTVFPMYERVEYLLPGEAAAWRGGEPMPHTTEH